MSSTSEPPPPPPSRAPGRRALVLATCAGACAVGLAAAGPTLALALAPLDAKGGGGRWVRTLKLAQLKDGEPRRVAIVADRRDAWTVERNVELGSAWLVRRGERVDALSAVCPHLGCSVNAVGPSPDGATGFSCPCHTSAFDAAGRRIGGPAPRDLDALATRIEDGWVEIELRRFRIGVAEKVET
jgi:Rieske Fe-S protein